jgi:hypothetical protein
MPLLPVLLPGGIGTSGGRSVPALPPSLGTPVGCPVFDGCVDGGFVPAACSRYCRHA